MDKIHKSRLEVLAYRSFRHVVKRQDEMAKAKKVSRRKRRGRTKSKEEPKKGGLFHGSETTIPPGIGRR